MSTRERAHPWFAQGVDVDLRQHWRDGGFGSVNKCEHGVALNKACIRCDLIRMLRSWYRRATS